MNFITKFARAYYNLCRQTSNELRVSERTHPKIWQKDYIVLRFINRNIKSAVKLQKINEPNILDLGCGNKPYQSLFTFNKYTGVDFNSKYADLSLDLNEPQQFAEQYDLIVCFDTIEHVFNTEALIKSFENNLKIGGLLLISAPFFYGLHDNPHDYHRFTKNYFKIFKSNSFNLKVLEQSNLYLSSLIISTNNILYRLPIPYFLKYPFYLLVNLFALVAELLSWLLIKIIPIKAIAEQMQSAPLEYFAVYEKK